MSRFESLHNKLSKTIKFNRAGWIVLHQWVNDPIVGERLDTIRLDDKDMAIDYIISSKGAYTVDSECKV